MDQDLAKQIQERFEELPVDVQRAIQSSDLEQKLQRVSTKHKLHIDQAGALGDEVRLVMLGFAAPDDFPQQLVEQLGLTTEQANALAQDVSNEIFVPIRESMQEFIEERALAEHLAADAAPAVQPLSEKSVIMPSKAASMAQPQAQTPAPQAVPPPPAPPRPSPEATAGTAKALQDTARLPSEALAKDGSKPPQAPAMPAAADVMLKEPTVSLPSAAPQTPAQAPKPPAPPQPPAAKTAPPPPAPYKTDPYREPVE